MDWIFTALNWVYALKGTALSLDEEHREHLESQGSNPAQQQHMTLGMQLGGSRLCRPSRRPGQSSTCTSGHLGSTVGLATAILLIVLLSCASNCGAFVMGISSFSFLERDCASCWSQGTPGSSARSACGGEGEVSEGWYCSW